MNDLNTGNLEATVDRFQFFNEVLEWHCHGEEAARLPYLGGRGTAGRPGLR